jgi:hypothetical protein
MELLAGPAPKIWRACSIPNLSDVAQKCTDLTVEAWKGRLGGIEVWTNGHCQQVINALRVD